MNDIPRRNRLDLLTPTELSLFNMVVEVESLGAHPLLTDVVILLGQARNKLADWVELPADGDSPEASIREGLEDIAAGRTREIESVRDLLESEN